MVDAVRGPNMPPPSGALARLKEVYVLSGESDSLKEKALEEIKRSVFGPDGGGALEKLDYNLFYANECGSKEVLECVSTLPFSGVKRLVVVRRAERWGDEDRKAIAGYLAKPHSATCLVLDTKDESLLSYIPSSDQNVAVLTFGRIPEFKLASWIREILSSCGKTADGEVVDLLAELFGKGEEGILEKEIQKLASFVGKRAHIRLEDAEEVLGKELVRSTFDLTDAMRKQDAPAALAVLQAIFGSTRPRVSDIIGLIAWQLKLLLKARSLFEAGRSEFEIKGALKAPRDVKGDLMAQVRMWRTEDLAAKLDILLEADVSIKTARLDPKTSLEMAVIRLCLA